MSREEKLLFAKERLKEFQNKKKLSKHEEPPSRQTDANSDSASFTGQYALRNDDLYNQLIKAKNQISELMEVNARLVAEDKPQPYNPPSNTTDDNYIRAFGDLVAEKTELMTKLSLAECRLEVVESQLQSDNVRTKTAEQNIFTLTETNKRLSMENENNKNIISQYKQELLGHQAQLKAVNDKLHSNEKELENYRSLLQQKSLMVVQCESELTTLRGQVNNFINSASLAKTEQLLEDELKLVQIQYDSLKSDHLARGDRINELENTLNMERNSFNLEFSSLRSAFEHKSAEFDELVDKYNNNVTELTECGKRKSELEVKTANLSGFIDTLLKENEDNVAQIQSLIQNNTNLTKSDQDMIRTNEQFAEMNARVMRTNDELTQINAQLSKNVESLFEEKTAVMKSNHQLTEDITKLVKENEDITKLNTQLIETRDILLNETQSEVMKDYKAEISELNSLVSEYKEMEVRMTEEIGMLKVENSELRSVCEATLNGKNEDVIKLSEEFEELRKKSRDLTVELENNSIYNASLVDKLNQKMLTDEGDNSEKYYLENKRLWKVVEELEVQNKAIGNYVILYREQRHILNHKVIAKDEVIKRLTNTCDSYRDKLLEVRSLVGSLINKEDVNGETANSIIEMTGGVRTSEVVERLVDVVKTSDDNIPVERLCKDCVGPIYIV